MTLYICVQALKSIIKCCLVKAALNGHRSIAFPAVGLGREEYAAADVCKAVVKAVEEYSDDNVSSPLTSIKVYLPPDALAVSHREVGCCSSSFGSVGVFNVK